jgi:hypothetical protein
MAVVQLDGVTFTDDTTDLAEAMWDAQEMARLAPGEAVAVTWDRERLVYFAMWAAGDESTPEYEADTGHSLVTTIAV